MVCRTCGSNRVLRDAWAEWDVEKQDWVLQNVFDNSFCEVCDCETGIDMVELTELYPLKDWWHEVINGDTQRSYEEWLISKGEQHGENVTPVEE